MKNIMWAGSARRDIERIRGYFYPEELYPLVAIAIVGAARFIATTPKAGPQVGHSFVRKWRVKRFPYLLFYEVVPEGIRILRVRHMAEDWASEYE